VYELFGLTEEEIAIVEGRIIETLNVLIPLKDGSVASVIR
jgi:hypothetical protein